MSLSETRAALVRGGPDVSYGDRADRAREEPMVVMPLKPEGESSGLYRVITAGDVYRVDLEETSCTCPDYRFNVGPDERTGCKHIKRAAIEISEGELPAPGQPVGDYLDAVEAIEQRLEERIASLRSDAGDSDHDEEVGDLCAILDRLMAERDDL